MDRTGPGGREFAIAAAVLAAVGIGFLVWAVFFNDDDDGLAAGDRPSPAVTATATSDDEAADEGAEEETLVDEEEFEGDFIDGEDVRLVGGDNPPDHVQLAEIREASVVSGDGNIVFSATLGETIPDAEELDGEQLELAWRIYPGPDPRYRLIGRLITEPEAFLLDDQSDDDLSTAEGDFPGSVSIEGATFRITLDPSQLDGFPDRFRWRLKTTVEDETDEDQASARDIAPNEGFGTFPS